MIIKTIYYLINSSKNLIDLVDFFNNNDESVFQAGYHVVDGALMCKNGHKFGVFNHKNIIMIISIRSEDSFQKLLNDKTLNPKFLVSRDEINSDEFYDENHDEVFKKGKSFEDNYALFNYLEEISFKFDDNSIPLSTDLLDYWYIPIRSNMVYKRINELCKNAKDIDDKDYIIIDEEIKCKDGRILGEKNKITVYFEFITQYKRPFQIA